MARVAIHLHKVNNQGKLLCCLCLLSRGSFLNFKVFFVVFLFVGYLGFAYGDALAANSFSPDASYEPVYMPRLTSTSVEIDGDNELPAEPNLAKTRFLKYPPVTSLAERVERLVYGIETDIKPELDHYGYEIRRYMTSVGNVRLFEEPDYLIEQIRNLKKARIIADYWGMSITEEIADIEKILDEDNDIDLGTRTAFKHNKVAAQTFLISLKSWIDTNERLLIHINSKPDIYEVLYPEILILVPTARVEFYNIYATKQAKLKDIQRYQPFALMVY